MKVSCKREYCASTDFLSTFKSFAGESAMSSCIAELLATAIAQQTNQVCVCVRVCVCVSVCVYGCAVPVLVHTLCPCLCWCRLVSCAGLRCMCFSAYFCTVSFCQHLRVHVRTQPFVSCMCRCCALNFMCLNIWLVKRPCAGACTSTHLFVKKRITTLAVKTTPHMKLRESTPHICLSVVSSYVFALK